MRIVRNKIATTAITIFLILSMTASTILVLTANAHTPPNTYKTYAFLSVEPNPVGIGQEAFVNFWIDKAPPTASAQYGDRWHNFTVTLVKPDGTSDLLGPFTSDDTGGSHTTFTPTVLGNYTFQFTFSGQTLTGDNPGPAGTAQPQYVGDYYQPSTSTKVTLAVQQEQIANYPSTALPTGYWQRPIYSENLDWYKIGGNWLGFAMQSHGGASYNVSGNFNPYSTGPTSAHIVWTKPLAFGGMIGGEFGGTEYASSYYQTPQYEPKFKGIVINGILYYMQVPGSSTYPEGWIAVDIRTGQQIWTKNNTQPFLCGQVLSYVSPNQFGGLSYLWTTEQTVKPNTGTTFGMYDAMTGNWILNIVNGTSLSKIVEGDDGSLLGYYTNNTDHTLNLWNSTKAILGPYDATSGYPVGWMWRPTQGASIPFSYGIQWSAPIATKISGQTISPNLGISMISSDVAVLTSSSSSISFTEGSTIMAGYNAHNGQLLWGPINRTYTPGDRIATSPAMQGMWFEFDHPKMTWSAYSLATGTQVWGPSEPYPNSWGYFVCYSPIAAYGYLYAADFAGYVHAYNISTGKLEWNFFTGESGYETPYGTYPLYHIETVADGKVYVEGGHTYSPPIFKGSQLYALNATTGEKIWSVSSFTTGNNAAAVLADGYLIEPNAYDNQLYCYNKGPSLTTVEAPLSNVAKGSDLVIRGTVMDVSPATKQVSAAFTSGVPAISDDSQSAWMEYVYMQQPKPSNATGVQVTLNVIDSNGNYRQIGSTTSDASGMFSFHWVPDIAGQYTVIANFAGTNSYYSSSAETSFYASEPAPTATPQPITTQPPTELYFVASTIAIIIAIAIATVLIIVTRKRP